MKKSTFLFFLAFVSLVSTNVFGQAQFTADKFSGCAPLTVKFTETGSATSWDWNFGNGNLSCCTLKVVTAQYGPGTYTVTLTINGGSKATHTITVFKSPISTFSLDDDTTCVGGAIKFTSTSTLGSAPIKTYSWGFGDGTDSTASNIVFHSFTLGGTYSVNLFVIDTNGCSNASTQSSKVYVIAAPVPRFTMSPASACNVPVTVTFNNQTSPPAVGYQWDFGDPTSGTNNTSALISPTHTYTVLGQYTVILTTKTGTCTAKDSTVFFAKNIVAGFNSVNTCLNSPVLFINTSVPPPNTSLWNFGDPASGLFNTSSLINPTHSYSTPGTYIVSLIAANGCVDSTKDTITVMPKPVLTLTTPDDSNYCKPSATIHFQVSSNPPLSSWQLYFADTANAFKDSINSPDTLYTFSNYGHYSVRLIGTDINGCRDTLIKLNYINIIAPSVDITSPHDSGCILKTFQFKDLVTLVQGDTIKKYFWNFGDGTPLDSTSGLVSVTHTYSLCAVDTVSLIITTTKGCSDTVVKNGWVRTGVKPTAGFKWHPDTVCYGDPVFFSDTSIVNGCKITGWSWSFVSFDSTTQTAFPDTGKWGAGLAVFSNGCADSVYKDSIITVLAPKPVLTYLPPTCADHFTIQFADSSHGADSLLWDFGDTLSGAMDTSTLKNPIHVFTKRGTYLVQLTAWNFTTHCSYIDTGTVVITDPKAVITGSVTQGCHPFFGVFNGLNSLDANTYAWNFGDPLSGILDTSNLPIPPLHNYIIPGTYTVTLIITDIYACKDTITQLVHSIGPIASFNATTLKGCRQFTDTLISTSIPEGSPVTQYSWNFNYPSLNDTSTSFTNPTVHTWTQNGIYTIRLVATDANGCSDDTILTNYIEVTFPAPQFSNIDTFICDNTIVPFTVNANGTAPFTYHWSFGDGQPDVTTTNSPSGSNTVTHSYLTNHTNHKLSVTVTDANGCDSTISQNITVLRPSAHFGIPKDSLKCQLTIPIYPTPKGDNITSWVWSINGPQGFTAGSTLADPAFQFTNPGRYYSTLTVTNPGCSDTYTDTSIVMDEFPVGYFTFDSLKRCPPAKVKFTTHLLNNAKYSYITWDFGDGRAGQTNYPDSTISHTYYSGTFHPNATINYKLKNGTLCGFSAPNSDSIVVFKVFTVNVTQDSIVIKEGKKDTLTSVLNTGTSVPPYGYNWNTYATGMTLPIYNTTSAIYTAMEHDTMIVLTVRDANGCEAYDTVFVEVKLCEVNLKIPNVFTPNGDSLNESYFINDLCDIENFKFTIYNRWGTVVYESSHYDFHWNGKDNNGKECSDGVYYYIIHGKRKNLYGYIQLVR